MKILRSSLLLSHLLCLSSASLLRSNYQDNRQLYSKTDGAGSKSNKSGKKSAYITYEQVSDYDTKKSGYTTYEEVYEYATKKSGSYSSKGSKKGTSKDAYDTKKSGSLADSSSSKGSKGDKKGGHNDSYDMKKTGTSYKSTKGSKSNTSKASKGSKTEGDDYDDSYHMKKNGVETKMIGYHGSKKDDDAYDYETKKTGSYSSKGSKTSKQSKAEEKSYSSSGSKKEKSYSSSGSKKGATYDYGSKKTNVSGKGIKKGGYVEYDEVLDYTMEQSDSSTDYDTKTGSVGKGNKKDGDHEYGTKGSSSGKGAKKGTDCFSSKKSGSSGKGGKKGGSYYDYKKSGDSDKGGKNGSGDHHYDYDTKMTGGYGKGGKKGSGHYEYDTKKNGSLSSKQSKRGSYDECDEEPIMTYPTTPEHAPSPSEDTDTEPEESAPAPVARPTNAPYAPPITKPTAAPAPAPVARPTNAPYAAPVTRPTAAPVSSPVSKATTAPYAPPVAKPSEAPAAAPVAKGTKAPETAPPAKGTTGPVANPTAAPKDTEEAPTPTAAPKDTEEAPTPTQSETPRPEAQTPEPESGSDTTPPPVEEGDADPASTTILEVASGIADLSTLVAVLETPAQADLLFALLGEGPFTVFAPSNAAFAKLAETVDINTLEAQALTFILAYHVYDGEVRSSDIETSFLTTLNGDGIYVAATDSGVMLNNNATVVQTDILGSNGVIHIIDQVLLPPLRDVASIATDDGFEILLEALGATELLTVLEGAGPFTLFAPTDAAFDKLGTPTIDALFADLPTLTNILMYHVTNGYIGSGMLGELQSIETLAEGGARISVRENGKVLNGNTKLTMTDILATNGVVHVIDTVLIPPAMGDPQ